MISTAPREQFIDPASAPPMPALLPDARDGDRADIAAAIRAEADIAVLVATSDPEEAIEVADRIFVLDSAGLRPFGDDDATREIADSSHRDGAPA